MVTFPLNTGKIIDPKEKRQVPKNTRHMKWGKPTGKARETKKSLANIKASNRAKGKVQRKSRKRNR